MVYRLSSLHAEQELRGSIPSLAAVILGLIFLLLSSHNMVERSLLNANHQNNNQHILTVIYICKELSISKCLSPFSVFLHISKSPV